MNEAMKVPALLVLIVACALQQAAQQSSLTPATTSPPTTAVSSSPPTSTTPSPPTGTTLSPPTSTTPSTPTGTTLSPPTSTTPSPPTSTTPSPTTSTILSPPTSTTPSPTASTTPSPPTSTTPSPPTSTPPSPPTSTTLSPPTSTTPSPPTSTTPSPPTSTTPSPPTSTTPSPPTSSPPSPPTSTTPSPPTSTTPSPPTSTTPSPPTNATSSPPTSTTPSPPTSTTPSSPTSTTPSSPTSTTPSPTTTTYDYCYSQPCANGGTCYNTPGSFTCSCTPDYTGTTCLTPVSSTTSMSTNSPGTTYDYCYTQPCANGGTCYSVSGSFTCSCTPDYTGTTCLTPVTSTTSTSVSTNSQGTTYDYCYTQPCANGGTCYSTPWYFNCSCTPDYTGSTCLTPVSSTTSTSTSTNSPATTYDYCYSQPCQNGGTCYPSYPTFYCVCMSDYTGYYCETLSSTAPTTSYDSPGTTYDYCYSQPCANGGTCYNTPGSFTCSCTPDFTGTTCLTPLTSTTSTSTSTNSPATTYDYCNSQPCQNGGSCYNDPSYPSFYCMCMSCYKGDVCETEVVTTDAATTTESSTAESTSITSVPMATSSTMASTRSQHDPCHKMPCNNSGTCNTDVGASLGYTCSCLPGFTGHRCERRDLLTAASSLRLNSTDSVKAAKDVIVNIREGAEGVASSTNKDALNTYVDTIKTLVDKMNGATIVDQDLRDTSEDIINATAIVMTSFQTCDSTTDAQTCSQENVAGKMQDLEDSVLALGDVLTERTDDFSFATDQMAVSFQKKATSTLVQNPVSSGGASVKLPENLVDKYGQEQLVLKVIVYDDVSYTSVTSTPSGPQVGPVVVSRLENENKDAILKVDRDDPITIGVTPPAIGDRSDGSSPQAVGDDAVVCQEQTQGAFLSVEYSIPSGRFLSLVGRFGDTPTDSVWDFAASVTPGSVSVTHAHDDVKVVTGVESARVYVTDLSGTYGRVCVRATFSGGATGRSKRAVMSPAIVVSTLSVVVWDSNSVTWSANENVELTQVDEAGQVEFESSFFGTFSLSEFVVTPNTIDFEAILFDFERYLQDSPYVLAVICCLLVASVLITVFLRRMDVGDTALWTYLPLVDNRDSDKFVYTLSVHTSLSSPRHVTATPFFLLVGQHGTTDIRVLADGIRENFRSGTVSNFILKSSVSLGNLLELRIWHDNKGKNPDWKLERVVVTDHATGDTALFICCDWLSTAKGDGKISRHIPALTPDFSDGSGMFDMVSKQRLFDDHLWLSVAKRPVYSTFTRVQRFLCAVALLFLAMVCNAMFYQGKEAVRQELRGVEIGALKINYRQVFVGAASSVIILVPALIMTLSFKRRRTKGAQSSASVTSLPALSAPRLPTLTVTPDVELLPLKSSSGPGEEGDLSRKNGTSNDGSKSRLVVSGGGFEAEQAVRFSAYRKLNDESCSVSMASSVETVSTACDSDVPAPTSQTSDDLKDCLIEETCCSSPPTETYLCSKAQQYVTTDDGKPMTGDQPEEGPHTVRKQYPGTVNVSAEHAAKYTFESSRSPKTKARSELLLPWWFIFVGYFFVVLSILTGAFFTFMYSLEWGGKTSLDWLLALFFSTSTGTFVIEPLKIVFVSVVLSCIFQRLARDEISTVAPCNLEVLHSTSFYHDKTTTAVPEVMSDPDETESAEELEKRRKNLHLHSRMYGVLRTLGGQAAYVTLVFVLCLHGNVPLTFLQNETIKSELALSELESSVTPGTSTWKWLREGLVPNILPLYLSNGDTMSVKEQWFLTDQYNYRVGPLTVTQYRVKETCDIANKLKVQIGNVRCVAEYNTNTEETSTFGRGWVPCTESCTDSAYVYDSGDNSAMAQETRLNLYGPGGYRVLLESRQRQALQTLDELETQGWLDEKTRAVNVEVNLFNANTRLFTQAKVLLEFPATGGCLSSPSLRTSRLYPYTSVWDYIVLLLQLVFVVVVVVRLCLVFKRVCFPAAGESRCSDTVVVVLLEVVLSLSAVVLYIVRIDRTIYVLERIRNKPEEFTSFDTVFFLDQVYVFCLSCCLFIAILSFLGPLSFNYHIYVLRRTLLNSRQHLTGLGLALLVVLVAFASLFVLFEGPVTYRLKNFPESFVTLLTVLLTMTKYPMLKTDGAMDGVQAVLHRVMYGLYCFVAAMMIMNFAITILNTFMADTQKVAREGGPAAHNGDLGQFIWNKLANLFIACGGGGRRHIEEPLPAKTQETTVTVASKAGDDFAQLEVKIEQMVGILTKMRPEAPLDNQLRAVHGELNRTRNRLVQAEFEAEQRRAEASLLKEKVQQLTSDNLVTEISSHDGKTFIRILDTRKNLLYLVVSTGSQCCAAPVSAAADVTMQLSRDLETETCRLVSRIVKLSDVPKPMDIESVQVGYPVTSSSRKECHAIAVKYTSDLPWVFLPAVPGAAVFTGLDDSMVWADASAVPECIAAVTMVRQESKVPRLVTQGTILRSCRECKFTTLNQSVFRVHEDTHGVTLKCRHADCGAQFLERYKMIRHLQEKHNYPLVCHWCGMAFNSLAALHEHMPLHFFRTFVCEDCGMRFTTLAQKDGHRFITH